MSTSGSTTFTTSRDGIIKAAMRKCAVLAKGQTPDTEDYTNGTEALNALVAEFMTLGMQMWKRIQYTFTPVAGTSLYQIGLGKTFNVAFPQKIHQAFIQDVSSNSRIPLNVISYQNYYLLPRTGSSGLPVQLMYQAFRNYGELNLWPTPDSGTASTKQITILYQTPIEYFSSSSDEMDFPLEWYNALVYGLASLLAPEFSVPLNDRGLLAKEAEKHLETAISFGTEDASYFVQPVTRMGG